jgi:DNA-binding transcriptional ArsR family regulator
MTDPAELFKILGVESRIRIIDLLKKSGPMCVSDLADKLGMTPAAISQHLRVLRTAGLVNRKREGYWIPYSLDESALEKCHSTLSKVCACGCYGVVCKPAGASTRKSLESYKKSLQAELRRVEKRLQELGD